MRTLLILPLATLVGLTTLTPDASAQAREVYQSAGEIAAPDSAQLALLSGPSLLAQADALVSMAQSVPAGAATYPLARQASHAARAALDAYQAAVTNSSDGYSSTADSAARVAIEMAELAATTAFRRPATVIVGESSAGNQEPSLVFVPNPAPAILLIDQGGDRVPPTTTGLTPQPFGAIPAAPSPYPAISRDSLPFGAAAVGRTPAVVAP